MPGSLLPAWRQQFKALSMSQLWQDVTGQSLEFMVVDSSAVVGASLGSE